MVEEDNVQSTGSQAAKWRRISVRSEEKILLVDPVRIDWIEAYGNYVRFHVGPQNYLLRGTLCRWEQRLARDGFVRTHRSAIVNLARVVSLQPTFAGDYTLQLSAGGYVPLSRTYRDAFFAALNEPVPDASATNGEAVV